MYAQLPSTTEKHKLLGCSGVHILCRPYYFKVSIRDSKMVQTFKKGFMTKLEYLICISVLSSFPSQCSAPIGCDQTVSCLSFVLSRPTAKATALFYLSTRTQRQKNSLFAVQRSNDNQRLRALWQQLCLYTALVCPINRLQALSVAQ